MGDPLINVFILNWNKNELTDALLSSLNLQRCPFEIFLLDNGSENPYQIPELNLSLTLERSEVNLGYSGGIQYLLKKFKLESDSYLWVINNDTEVGSIDWFNMIKHIQGCKSSLHLPRITNYDGTEQSRYHHWQPIKLWQESNDYPKRDMGDLFVAPLIPISAVNTLTLFPDFFHTYSEDFDACFAIAMSGSWICREIGAELKHHLSSSRPTEISAANEMKIQGLRNLMISVLLNYSKRSLIKYSIPIFVRIILFSIKQHHHNNGKAFWKNVKTISSSFTVARKHKYIRIARQKNRRLKDKDIFTKSI
jgi:GT2 family glycosyltransferase